MRLPSLHHLLFAPMRALVATHLYLRRFVVEHLRRHSHRAPNDELTPAMARLPAPGGVLRPPFEVQAPLLALLPTPALGLSKARVSFEQEISFCSRRTEGGGDRPSLSLELRGRPTVSRTRCRWRRAPTVQVQLALTQTPAPAGVSRLQERLLRHLRARALSPRR